MNILLDIVQQRDNLLDMSGKENNIRLAGREIFRGYFCWICPAQRISYFQ